MPVNGSPLMPLPELPWTATGLHVDTTDDPALMIIAHSDGAVTFDKSAAPALAAAILSGSGSDNHRVIDLGGPLPEVKRMDDQIWAGESDPHDVGTDYRASCLEIIRSELAVIEAYPHAHHDPAEVEAIAVALATHAGQANDIGPWREDARIALDTIAALRGQA